MTNPTATETREARILEAMIELGRDLMAARDEASSAAAASGLSNETFQFLLGMSIGFDRSDHFSARHSASGWPSMVVVFWGV